MMGKYFKKTPIFSKTLNPLYRVSKWPEGASNRCYSTGKNFKASENFFTKFHDFASKRSGDFGKNWRFFSKFERKIFEFNLSGKYLSLSGKYLSLSGKYLSLI